MPMRRNGVIGQDRVHVRVLPIGARMRVVCAQEAVDSARDKIGFSHTAARSIIKSRRFSFNFARCLRNVEIERRVTG